MTMAVLPLTGKIEVTAAASTGGADAFLLCTGIGILILFSLVGLSILVWALRRKR